MPAEDLACLASREGERHLGAEEGEGLPEHILAGDEMFREEHERRDADAAAEEKRARPFGMRREALADGPEEGESIAGTRAAQSLQPRALGLVEDFHPAWAWCGAHQRQRPAHGDGLVAGQVREAAGRGMRGALRRLDADHELPGLEGRVLKDAAFLEEDRAAGSLSHLGAPGARITVASTAMRTATPFLT